MSLTCHITMIYLCHIRIFYADTVFLNVSKSMIVVTEAEWLMK